MQIPIYLKYYKQAQILAKKNYSDNISEGHSGSLTFLEGLLRNKNIVSEVYLGESEIPLEKVKGTNSYARAVSFSSNFMPIPNYQTEFAHKWISVCRAHSEEGLRDSIKVYEYLNWYFVIEGNKRVSVMKFFDVYSYSAEITRLLPKYDENDKTIRIYYEFLKFTKATKIKSIWFTNENSFNTLLQYIEFFEPEDKYSDNKYKAFERDVYLPFRKIYHEAGGKNLNITTGDALLEYIKLYGTPSKDDIYSQTTLPTRLKSLISELKTLENQSHITIETEENIKEKSFVSTITSLIKGKKHYEIAFLYPKSVNTSNWSYYHDQGRIYVEHELSEYIKTTYYENIPENNNCYNEISRIAKKGYDMIFSTSPAFINGTLKAALEFDSIAFFNCSQSYSFKHVTTFFGRIFEAKFLSGIIAGSVSKGNQIGYIGTFPIPEVVSCVNAFALGVKTVSPDSKVYTAWMNQWDSAISTEEIEMDMLSKGIDIISHHNIVGKSEISKGYGLYRICIENGMITKDHLASPIWNFGIFYEKIICNYIDQHSSIITPISSSKKGISFWWGMNAEVVDLVYSNRLVPQRTRNLVDYLKFGIKNMSFNIFSGPIFDNEGVLRIKDNSIAETDEMLSMNWFVDNVITEILDSDYNHPNTNLLAGKIE